MNSKILNNKKGETLLEVLIALAIISMIGLSFFKVIDKTTLNNRKNEIDIKMMNIAQTELESLSKSIKEGSTKMTKFDGREYDFVSDAKPYTIEDDEKLKYNVDIEVYRKDTKKSNGGKQASLYTIGVKVALNYENKEQKKLLTKRSVIIKTKVLGKYK